MVGIAPAALGCGGGTSTAPDRPCRTGRRVPDPGIAERVPGASLHVGRTSRLISARRAS